MKQNESKLQQSCVRWFRLQYPNYCNLLFAIPNGGQRNIITAKRMKAEGVVAGVPDLFLAVPNNYSGLFVEMKIKGNKLTESQKEMIKKLEMMNYNCVVCYSFDEFVLCLKKYLK